jgi:hypothetical protein
VTLYGLSDPALSELGFEDFLDKLLVRVNALAGYGPARAQELAPGSPLGGFL